MKSIIQLIEEKNFKDARKEVLNSNEANLAEILEELDKENALILYRMLPKNMAAEVFSHLSNDQQRQIIISITDKEIKNIIDDLYFDDKIDFIEEMPANVVKKILANTNPEERKLINQFLNYPENSAGSIMTIEFVDLKKELTVKQAMEHIKKIGIEKEIIYTCYITDSQRKLEGIVSLRKLVTSDESLTINDIMETNIINVNTHDDQEEVANMMKKYDFVAMPVVDKEKRLIGIITVDDIVDVIEQENTEDMQKMAAMAPSEKEYLEEKTIDLVKHRLPWLLILMISATFTGGIITFFEDALAEVVVLTAFIPLLMDTAGNAGAQSSTLVIRSLALGDIKTSDFLKVMFKELKVSLIVGLILSIINFGRIVLFTPSGFDVALVVSITLFITITLAKTVGVILPIVATKVKLDPAIMASPLITTIVDAIALVVYFILAVAILNISV